MPGTVLGRIDVEGGTLTSTVLSTHVCIVPCCSRVHSMNWMRREIRFITVPTMGKCCPAICIRIPVSGTLFRCLFPFLNLMYPSVNRQIQEGLVNTYKESGFFPEWASPGHRGCMIGNNSASVLADAYLKGVKVEDVQTLYEGLINGTKNVHPEVSSTGRLGYEYYNKLGYVPYDVKINENTARTLEYAYNDWCIYRMAKELNRPKKEQKLFAERAMNYRNVFDKEAS